jgi:hypothetical protein
LKVGLCVVMISTLEEVARAWQTQIRSNTRGN